MSDLKTQTLSGMLWSFVQRFGTMAISFVSNMVLARLLTPEDYGTIGMLMIFIVIANTFVDGGFGSALIQKKTPTQEDYSTIFWWNMFLSIVLYGLLFLGAPAVAHFFNLPILTKVLRVQGLVLILNALSIIQTNQLRKQLQFKRLASITVTSAILSAGIAIILAHRGWGVWTLVAQQLMMSGFNAILLWTFNKWHPLLMFSKESFKQLFGFGGFMLVSNLINTFCNNIQGFLNGKLFPPATLGYYSQARKLEEIPSTSLTNIVDQVSYPILSKFQDDKQKLIAIINRLVLSVSFVTIPLMLTLIILANPLILFLYSEKWLPCVPYFRILCFAGLAISLQGIHFCAVASVGKSKEMFKWTIVKRALGLIYLVVGITIWDIYGLLWGCVAGSWTILIINAYLTSVYIGYRFKQQIIDLLPTIVLATVGYFATMIALSFCNMGEVLTAIVHAVAFIVVYLSSAHLFNIYAYRQIKEAGLEYIKRFRNKL